MGPRTVSDKRLKGVREDLNGVCQACTELSEAFVLRLNSVGEAFEARLGSIA